MEDSKSHEKVECNKIDVNEFLVYLYHNNLLTKINNNFSITDEKFKNELRQYVKAQSCPNVDDILVKSKIITRNSNDFDLININSKLLFECENYILNEIDKQQIKTTLMKHVIDLENGEKKPEFYSRKEKLDFKTCVSYKKFLSFESSDYPCNICMLGFPSEESFEEHLEIHTSTSNFEWIEKNTGSPFPRFQIFYQISEDTNYYKFTLNTDYSGIKLNSIVTVRSKDIPLLANHQTQEKEIDEGESYEFVVDKHLFIKSVEQPIYVIFNMYVNAEQNQSERFVELHLIRPNLFIPQNKPKGGIIKRSELKTKKGSLLEYFPSNGLKELYNNKENFDERNLFDINEDFRKFCEDDKKVLKSSNISNIFKFLLEMEDIETEKFYQHFSQKEATIKYIRSGKDFEYFVKLQNLPDDDALLQNTINCGDEIILVCNNNFISVNNILNMNEKRTNVKTVKTKFFGGISNIYGTTVYFENRSKEKIDINKKYDIHFRPNRMNFKYQYAALNAFDQYSLLSLYLFPENRTCNSPASVDLNIINENVRTNPEQKEAVMNIVDGIKDFLPYIIVGPPGKYVIYMSIFLIEEVKNYVTNTRIPCIFLGTGKTTTLIESILQLQIKKPHAKVLVTAGSNAACDEIAKRLVKLVNSNFNDVKMFRLYSKSAEKSCEHKDKILIESSNLSYGYHYYPSLEEINKYNIVICTTSLVGRLKAAGLQSNFFSYCFVDECAASTEPEILVVIEAIFHSEINIVIAGDPKQLGPILQSHRAGEYGLKYSLLERLLQRECYQVNFDKTYNRRIQTRLIRNFRSHAAILTISNRLFYSNDLLACAPKDLTHWTTCWYKLPKQEIPLIFHCVNGFTKKDKYSTSLFNLKEIVTVIDYVKRLMYFKINGRRIKEEDIGVISPYKKQCTIIREELDKRNWYKIATGSVEIFQGQEKPIIIISNVRSIHSERRGVGFLTNEKRLNVMLTRAQALLIIIGNLECLSSIPNWKESIGYCRQKDVLIQSKNKIEDEKLLDSIVSNLKNFDILSE